MLSRVEWVRTGSEGGEDSGPSDSSSKEVDTEGGGLGKDNEGEGVYVDARLAV